MAVVLPRRDPGALQWPVHFRKWPKQQSLLHRWTTHWCPVNQRRLFWGRLVRSTFSLSSSLLEGSDGEGRGRVVRMVISGIDLPTALSFLPVYRCHCQGQCSNMV